MKKFASYLIPSLIASVLMSMYAIVDGIFIGQKIGDSGLAAINICWPITAFLQSIGTAVGLACGIYIQILNAKKEEDHANRIKGMSILLIVVLGIVFGLILYFVKEPLIRLLGTKDISFDYAVSYTRIILIGSVFQMLGMSLIPILKNSNKVKLAMGASLSSIFTNLLLDYIFIYLLNMDLVGAALGSVIAQVVSCLFCLLALGRELKGFKFSKKDIFELGKMSIAPFVLNYTYSIVIIITNLVCSYYGGDEAVAAYTLLSYLAYINIALSCAVGDSIQPLFSYQHELRKFTENRKMLIKCLLISLSCALVLAILMITLKQPLGQLYNLSNTAFGYYQHAVWYYAIGALLIGVIKVISSYFYSINQKKYANILILLEPFVITPLMIWIFCSVYQLYGVWVSYIGVQGVLFMAAILLYFLSQNKIQKQSDILN